MSVFWIMKFKCLIFIVGIILLSSCSEQRKCLRFQQKHPNCFTNVVIRDTFKQVDIDTVTQLKVDSSALDSLVDLFFQSIKMDTLVMFDTIYQNQLKYGLKKALRNTPCSAEPVHIDNDLYKLDITAKDGKINFNVTIKPRTVEHVVPVINAKKENKYLPFFSGIFIGAGLLALIIVLSKSKNKYYV